MFPASFVHAHAAHADWRAALAECQGQVQAQIEARAAQRDESAPFTLGWCYLSDYYAPASEAILDELHRSLPGIAWVGTAGVGVAASGIEYIDEPALVLMVAPLPRESFRLFSGQQPLPATSSGFVAYTALVHAEGSTPDVQELLHELSARTTTGYLFGGLSSARNRPLHMAEGVFTGGLSGVLFGPEVGLISRVTQGCQPVGPVRTITQAERNLVFTLDGKPALDCVLQDLGLDRDLPVDALSQALSTTLAGLSTGVEDVPTWPGKFGADTLVRHVVGVDPEHRVLAIADRVEPGMHLAFCTRNREAARADLVRIATEIRAELECDTARHMSGALYVSCSGRGGPHFGARHAELQTVRNALGEVPLVGFFAGGEIARSHLYGYTGVLTVFTNRD
ncbi:FIST N-terminal domain-containing protein [Paraburkholderia sp. BL10I2N1]|uniref:FIST signal transduction protein n=1 Tax=Paraburkholderia sp. BL10I2N1 TaxID=1938796 RepID=UPI00105F86D5|nr:FIST N-terminal domain-containing protein [Paraburkholderia sp. BL10I2N1]TDN61280.1 small ligand-binding sensory domain FIST [Paraburkholderia sp. BL10I2N1]